MRQERPTRRESRFCASCDERATLGLPQRYVHAPKRALETIYWDVQIAARVRKKRMSTGYRQPQPAMEPAVLGVIVDGRIVIEAERQHLKATQFLRQIAQA